MVSIHKKEGREISFRVTPKKLLSGCRRLFFSKQVPEKVRILFPILPKLPKMGPEK